MSEQPSPPIDFRDFIPHGKCVPGSNADPDMVRQFNELDRGQEEIAGVVLEAAKAACRGCAQLPHCEAQRPKIAQELWRHGAGMYVVGGKVVTARQKRTEQELREPALQFDLSELPPDPAKKLEIIRQAMRVEQVKLGGPFPNEAKRATEAFLECFRTEEPQAHQKILEILGERGMSLSVRYATTTITRLVDFVGFQAGLRTNQRATAIDDQEEKPFLSHVLHEAAAIKDEFKLKNAPVLVLYHGIDFYRRLHERHVDAYLSEGEFRQIVNDRPRNPHAALTAYAARVARHKTELPMVSASTIRRKAATTKHVSRDTVTQKAQLLGHFADNPHVTAGKIEYALTNRPDDPQEALEQFIERTEEGRRKFAGQPEATDEVIAHFAWHNSKQYEDRLHSYIRDMGDLQAKYGQNPDFTAGMLRRFAREGSGGERTPLEVAAEYKKHLEEFRQLNTGRIVLPDSFLKERALMGDAHNFEDIRRDHLLKILQSRLNARANRRNEQTLPRWAFKRVLEIYDIEVADVVCENVYKLLNEGLLQIVTSEMLVLQHEMAAQVLGVIGDPKSRQHFTFAPALRELRASERLALLHDFSLLRLLYGRDFDDSLIARTTGQQDVNGHGTDIVLPHCYELLASSKATEPFTLAELTKDLIEFVGQQEIDVADTPEYGEGSIDTLVAGEQMSLLEFGGIESLKDVELPSLHKLWLVQRIVSCYQPDRQKKAWQAAAKALADGVIQISGATLEECNAAFANRYANLTDLERAVLARVLSLDQLLYGKDLDITLRHRLGTDDLVAWARINMGPKLRAAKIEGEV